MSSHTFNREITIWKDRPLFIIWALLGGVSGVILGFLLSDDPVAYVLVAVLGVLTFGPIVLRLHTKDFNLAEPGIWFALYYFANFGMRRAYIAISGNQRFAGQLPPGSQGYYLDLALLYAVIGLLAFWVGYSSRLGAMVNSTLPALPSQWNEGRAWPIALALIVIGWIIRIGFMYVNSGGLMNWITTPGTTVLLTGYSRLLAAIATMGVLALFVLVLRHGTWMRWVMFGAVLTFEFTYKALNGWRSGLLFLPLGLLVIYYLCSDRSRSTNLRFLSGTLGLVATFIAAFPLLSALRYSNLSSNLGSIFESLPLAETISTVSRRLHGLDSLALLIYAVPREVSYTYGDDLWLVLAAWIPREIWSGKPIINPGTRFVLAIVNPDTNVLYGISTSLPGSFYWKLGLPGIILGMLLVGILWRFLHEYLVRPQGNHSNILVVGALFPMFFTMAGGTLIGLFTHNLMEAGMVVVFALLLSGGRLQN